MVAPNNAVGFRPGDRVQLLSGYLAWPATTEAGPSRARVVATFLSGRDRIRFVRARDDVPGGAIVADEHGERWYCPTDYLSAGWITDPSGAVA